MKKKKIDMELKNIYKNMTQRKFQFAVVYYHICGPSGIYSMTVEVNVAKSLIPIQ